jgi:hypothetical protein
VLEDMVAMRWIILRRLGFGLVLTLIAMIWRGALLVLAPWRDAPGAVTAIWMAMGAGVSVFDPKHPF